jgi:hypothetical protein
MLRYKRLLRVSRLYKQLNTEALEAIKSPLWVGAMALLINSKKSKWFRWHDSGDVQDVDHLLKIFAVCKLTPETRHWLPTREAWTKDFLDQVPSNLTLRFSMPMIDQACRWQLGQHVNGGEWSG